MNEIVSRRVLVVDDELLIAMDIEQILVDLGESVIGPATNLDSALKLAASEQIDCAFLDVNLGHGVSVAPVVDILRARRIPFVFETGYGQDAPIILSKSYPSIAKPFTKSAIEKALRNVLGGDVTLNGSLLKKFRFSGFRSLHSSVSAKAG